MFRVRPHGLTLVDVVDSGGEFPVSLASHGDLLYVLNAGGEGNVTGFDFDSHLDVVSETVDTFQRATCWIAGGGRYVYTANTQAASCPPAARRGSPSGERAGPRSSGSAIVTLAD